MQSIEEYLSWTAAKKAELNAAKPTDSKVRVLTKNAVPVRYRGTARMVITDLVRRREAKKARALTGDIRLHLGCGGEHKDGWVNVDLVGDPVDFAWNLARPLPFEDGTVAAVFHEHVLEHIPLADGLRFMRECKRVLKPGGVMRVGVPDAGRLARSYADGRAYLEEIHPGRPTAMLALQELFYWHRHTTMYDTETLALVFKDAGFADPKERAYGESAIDGPAPDTEVRRAESLYMEAIA